MTLIFPSRLNLIQFMGKILKDAYKLNSNKLTITAAYTEDEKNLALKDYQAEILSGDPSSRS
ncbi:MAG TPA: hypothetical protein VGO09_10765 [Flavisolibacter sp.]|nr:hypothetical protein [Flavisolibacter sp.]